MKQNHLSFLFILTPFFFLSPPSKAQEAHGGVKPLRWGADPDGGIPYVFQDPDDPGKTIGFEMDLAGALAKQLGRDITFVKSPPFAEYSTTSGFKNRGIQDRIQ